MLLDHTTKGVPPQAVTSRRAAGDMGWNLLQEHFDLPACVLRHSAIENNLRWMQSLVNDQGALFSPHGKTTMSPELFDMQLKAGAWAITLATAHQVRVARAFGLKRIFYANQLTGRPFIDFIVDALRTDDSFEFIFLVDDAQNVQDIERAAQTAGLAGGRLQVLVELGYPGGRCGCRSVDEALALAARVAASPVIDLIGIEGFEGYLQAPDEAALERKVRDFLQAMISLTQQCHDKGFFAPGQTLFSVGGSAFYDLVFNEAGTTGALPPGCRVLTRSGCYLTHDAGMYRNFFEQIKIRNPDIGHRDEGLMDALEIWGYVLSRPEAGRLIVNVGKRDLSPDELPVAHTAVRFRSGDGSSRPEALVDHRAVALNDQHCHIECPADSPLVPGDAVIFGASHPCLTFDKWRNIFLRDDDYNIVGAVSTWF